MLIVLLLLVYNVVCIIQRACEHACAALSNRVNAAKNMNPQMPIHSSRICITRDSNEQCVYCARGGDVAHAKARGMESDQNAWNQGWEGKRVRTTWREQGT